ncbi:MAG: ribonuclease BN [Chromatiales bacterium 21-64-14]|nr:MAG: ribonuclease BN [Chromatiales bacterium 21-64-14]HQU15702.1 YhjD/YihY/BrkB family envelope integrity protein [Gammaproteobacteria bacterium]
MNLGWGELKKGVERLVWAEEGPDQSPARRRVVYPLRLTWAVFRELAEGQLTLRAMSLVYTTLLSLVPLLALSFSVLKAFGVHNQIEPFLFHVLAPLGERGVEIANRIIEFVDNLKVGVLGAIGLAMLIYTVVSLIQKIEHSFNYIWHVTRLRRMAQRFSDYLSVILIGPVLIFSAIGITASVLNNSIVQQLTAIEPFGTAIFLLGKLIPYFLIIGAFAFIYTFIPNTRVQFRAAMTGAVVAGVLWESAGWAFASFVVSSTRYTAIYSSFAILVMFMIWLYMSWLILLVGATIAFYVQHPEHLAAHRRRPRISARLREHLALLVMVLVGRHYYEGRPAWTEDDLLRRLRIPMEAVDSVLEPLVRNGLLILTADDPPTYLPGRDLETIRSKAVLDVVRTAEESAGADLGAGAPLRSEPGVEAILARMDQAVQSALGESTVKQLVVADTVRAAVPRS